ncbi:MAG: LexA family transcriptional regulator [Saprospiraceae bacterium]
MWIGENLKFLRAKYKLSQQALADKLNVTRTSLSDYERMHTQMSNETLVKVSDVFDISLDALLKKRLEEEDLEVLRNEELRILAISVDSKNRTNIELVDTKAEAGYVEYFGNPQFIKELPKISFPGIPEGTYRGFQIQGDSMLPMKSGSIVICTYVENLKNIKSGMTYVIITKMDGVVFKRVITDQSKKSVTAISDNPIFPPFKLNFQDIQEIWQYYAHLGFEDLKDSFEQYHTDKIQDIHKKINEVHGFLLQPE